MSSLDIHSPEVAQPVNSALQIALVDLLASVGVQPSAVFGHSSGEIAAAYAIGALSAEEAMMVAYFRGLCTAELVQENPFPGAMIAVGLSEDDVFPYIEQVADQFGSTRLEVACINSQRNVTISGQGCQVDALARILKSEKIFARKLMVPVAYHSSYMKEIASTYRDKIQSLKTNAAPLLCESTRAMISTVTGDSVTTPDLRSPEYWVQNLVSPVQFARAFKQVCTNPRRNMSKKLDESHRSYLGINFLLEVGPHSALQGPVRDMLDTLPWGRSVHYAPTIRRSEPATETLLNALGYIDGFGCSIDLERVNQVSGQAEKRDKALMLTNLPQYPFDHSTAFWRESRIGKRFRLAKQGKLDLLGKPTSDWNNLEAQWRNNIRVSEMSWVKDHVVNGALIYPAAGMLVMAIEAANQMADLSRLIRGFELKDVRFMRALTVPQTIDGVETSLHLRRPTNDSSVLMDCVPTLFLQRKGLGRELSRFDQNRLRVIAKRGR
jgi:acyl transferase domain-containing protein